MFLTRGTLWSDQTLLSSGFASLVVDVVVVVTADEDAAVVAVGGSPVAGPGLNPAQLFAEGTVGVPVAWQVSSHLK